MGPCISKSSKTKQKKETDFKENSKKEDKEEEQGPKSKNVHYKEDEKKEANEDEKEHQKEKDFGEFKADEILPKKAIEKMNSINIFLRIKHISILQRNRTPFFPKEPQKTR